MAYAAFDPALSVGSAKSSANNLVPETRGLWHAESIGDEFQDNCFEAELIK